MTETPDDLAELLDPRPAALSPAFKADVLRQTERRLARGRWLRRSARAALVAGVFAAGAALGWSARPERERTIELAGEVPPIVVPVPLPVPVPDRSTAAAPRAPLTASGAELAAEQQDDASAAARLYRQAGDAFLREQDYTNATRCYRLYLTRAGDEALALNSDDSWLLVSLKNIAFKERFDATKNDG